MMKFFDLKKAMVVSMLFACYALKAQMQVNITWTPGAFAAEPGYAIVNSATGAVVFCEPSGGSAPTNVPGLILPPGEYEVRMFDSFGDGWNGANLNVQLANAPGTVLFNGTLPAPAAPITAAMQTQGLATCPATLPLGTPTMVIPFPGMATPPTGTTIITGGGVLLTVPPPPTSFVIPAPGAVANINWTAPGTFPGETAVLIVNSATGAVVFCETGNSANIGGLTSSATGLALPAGNYAVYAYDGFGDGWNGSVLTINFTSGGASLNSGGTTSTITISAATTTPPVSGAGSAGNPATCPTTLTTLPITGFTSFTASTGLTPPVTPVVRRFTVPAAACSIVCPANVTANPPLGTCGGAMVSNLAPSGTLAGCTVTNTFNNSPNASGMYPMGVTTVTYRAVDTVGAISTCSFTVSVIDNEAPVITCPASVTVNLAPGACRIPVNYNPATATDNCPLPVLGTPVTFTGNQTTGNAGSQTLVFNVTNNNTTAVQLNHINGFFNAGANPVQIWRTNIPGTGVGNVTNPAAWTLLSTTNITQAAVGINNTPLPVGILLQPGQTVGLAAVTPGATTFLAYNFAAGPHTFTNNGLTLQGISGTNGTFAGTVFSPRTWAANINFSPFVLIPASNLPTTLVSGPASGSNFEIGVTNVTYQATDAAGNTARCTFTVTVNENANVLRTLTCIGHTNISLGANCSRVLDAAPFLVGGPYRCFEKYVVEVDRIGGLGDGPWEPGIIGAADKGRTIAYRVTDPDTGNSCWGEMLVEDKLPPTLTNCSNLTLPCGASTAPTSAPIMLTGTASVAGLPRNGDPSFGPLNIAFPSVPANAIITDVNFKIDNDVDGGGGSWLGDLNISLRSPAGTTVNLWQANWCNSNQDLIVTFDDEGVSLPPSAANCGNGSFRSNQPIQVPISVTATNPTALAAFDGQNPSGNWVLTINDVFNDAGIDNILRVAELVVAYTLPTGNAPVATDNCGMVNLTYVDNIVQGSCALGFSSRINRVWTATDMNGMTATCVQQITLGIPNIASVVAPPNYDDITLPSIACNLAPRNAAGQIDPSLLTPDALVLRGLVGYPTVSGNPISCTLGGTYSDQYLTICDGSRKIRREWQVIDWCTGANRTFVQLIKINDNRGPFVEGFQTEVRTTIVNDTVSFNPLVVNQRTQLDTFSVYRPNPTANPNTALDVLAGDISIRIRNGVISTAVGDTAFNLIYRTANLGANCTAAINLPDFVVNDACSSFDTTGGNKIYADVIGLGSNPGDTLGVFRYNGTFADFPGNNSWYGDTLAQFGFTGQLPPGRHQVRYTVTDKCGNISNNILRFTLQIVDLTPPTVICDKNTVVSLGYDDPSDCYLPDTALCTFAGVTYVDAANFDDGSYDNCGNIRFTVRRMPVDTFRLGTTAVPRFSKAIELLNGANGTGDCFRYNSNRCTPLDADEQTIFGLAALPSEFAIATNFYGNMAISTCNVIPPYDPTTPFFPTLRNFPVLNYQYTPVRGTTVNLAGNTNQTGPCSGGALAFVPVAGAIPANLADANGLADNRVVSFGAGSVYDVFLAVLEPGSDFVIRWRAVGGPAVVRIDTVSRPPSPPFIASAGTITVTNTNLHYYGTKVGNPGGAGLNGNYRLTVISGTIEIDASEYRDQNCIGGIALIGSEQIKFYCDEVNTTQTVILRAYQVNPDGRLQLNQFNEPIFDECMVQVRVEDKLRPTCIAPPNVTVSCKTFDPSLWAYGTPTVSDNCALDITKVYNGKKGITHSSTDNLNTCNEGTITRTFTVFDKGGLTSRCTQTVTVVGDQDYFLHFPGDTVVQACSSNRSYGEPRFFRKDCELIATSFTDDTLFAAVGACYQINRKWKVVNWCTFNANLPCIQVPNPFNLPNVTNEPDVKVTPYPSTTQGIPADSISTIAPTLQGQQGVDYSTFWSANANCYEYTQVILIRDTQLPTIIRSQPDTLFADLTSNDPNLYNDPFFNDPIHNTHDLCEGPVDLKITATDLCTGANLLVRYLLFLDMDNDGTMETVVNSFVPPMPGMINVGNAALPNFQGGTPLRFDKRAVGAGDRFIFSTQRTVGANNQVTSTVAFTTQNAPNSFVQPQLPAGKHKIKWYVQDGCGNEVTHEHLFEVKDRKAPTIVCSPISVNIMPTRMIDVWDSEVLVYDEDNCTPSDQLKTAIRIAGTGSGFPVDAQGNPIKSVRFNCSHIAPPSQIVEVWSIDKAGNADFCLTTVNVQDNGNHCPGSTAGNKSIAGDIKGQLNTGVKGLQDVQVSVNGSHPAIATNFNHTSTTDVNGHYAVLNAIPTAANFTITPVKDGDYLNGVEIIDVLKIQRHILGLEPFSSPYKMIAADVNNTGSITSSDMVELRKLILGAYTALPNVASYRFVDKSYTFPNPNNPFVPKFPELISVAQLATDKMDNNFEAVKMGDVTGNAQFNVNSGAGDRTVGTTLFDVQNRQVVKGEEFTVEFAAADRLTSYQFTMNAKGLTILDVIPGAGMDINNFAVFADKGMLTTAVEEADAKSSFSVKFRATESGELSKMLSVSSQITKAVAFVSDNERNEVAFRFNGQGGTVVTGVGFELYQNQPNPFISSTTIGFHLPEAATATLTVTDELGRTLYTTKGDFAKGYNAITLERSKLNTTGVLFYTVESAQFSATRQMIQTK